MTANQNRGPALDDVLADIAAAPSPPDAQVLRVWTAKYPEFAAEIVDFATDWVEMEAARSEHVVTAEDIDVVVNRTMSRVQAILDAAERPEVVTDLTADIRAAGYDLDAFQRVVGIDRSILDCLISRLIKPATVPVRLVQVLAEALNRTVECVRDYLCRPPQQVTAYKARNSGLSDAEKARWLAEVPDPALRE
jgi:hypothetical protein